MLNPTPAARPVKKLTIGVAQPDRSGDQDSALNEIRASTTSSSRIPPPPRSPARARPARALVRTAIARAPSAAKAKGRADPPARPAPPGRRPRAVRAATRRAGPALGRAPAGLARRCPHGGDARPTVACSCFLSASAARARRGYGPLPRRAPVRTTTTRPSGRPGAHAGAATARSSSRQGPTAWGPRSTSAFGEPLNDAHRRGSIENSSSTCVARVAIAIARRRPTSGSKRRLNPIQGAGRSAARAAAPAASPAGGFSTSEGTPTAEKRQRQ